MPEQSVEETSNVPVPQIVKFCTRVAGAHVRDQLEDV